MKLRDSEFQCNLHLLNVDCPASVNKDMFDNKLVFAFKFKSKTIGEFFS